ncbi:MAG: cytidine deaminase [Clostridiales bacterium]|jgi:cytidine deaminase|nr:cytidine deaminase [Clostridiales bacterium]
MIDYEFYLKQARLAMQNSYAPYSGFRVGACVLTDSGNFYLGTNVENASYGASICAERSAVSAAVTAGDGKISAVFIISDSDYFTTPCGVCRQVISEFAFPDAEIICANSKGTYKVYTLIELLPEAFNL